MTRLAGRQTQQIQSDSACEVRSRESCREQVKFRVDLTPALTPLNSFLQLEDTIDALTIHPWACSHNSIRTWRIRRALPLGSDRDLDRAAVLATGDGFDQDPFSSL
jgi:hypothetical protein